jgi:hypothetical protein
MWSTVSAAFGRALRKAMHGTIGYPLPIARYQFSLNAPSSDGASVTMVAFQADDCQRNRDVRFTSTNRHPETETSGPKSAIGLNRSRGKALRRAAWPCQQWTARWERLS